MLSRDLGHVLLRSLPFAAVLLGLVPEGTWSVPNCGLIRADEGPIASLFHALFLFIHPKNKLTFLLLLLLHYIVSFQLTQIQNILICAAKSLLSQTVCVVIYLCTLSVRVNIYSLLRVV